MVERLLANTTESTHDPPEQMSLHAAGKNLDKGLTERLLAEGADANALIPYDCTPLLAVKYSESDKNAHSIVSVLLDAGAELGRRSAAGYTALHYSA